MPPPSGRYSANPRPRPVAQGHEPAADPRVMDETDTPTRPVAAAGEKARARAILASIRTLQQVESEQRPPTTVERDILAGFGGFGAVALSLFPDPVTGRYKDAGWQVLGDDLEALLSPAEYDSAKRTIFSQFFTSPVVMDAMHEALKRLGVPEGATVLEPGCGTGNFMSHSRPGQRFIGVELDSVSGRIARALHPAGRHSGSRASRRAASRPSMP